MRKQEQHHDAVMRRAQYHAALAPLADPAEWVRRAGREWCRFLEVEGQRKIHIARRLLAGDRPPPPKHLGRVIEMRPRQPRRRMA